MATNIAYSMGFATLQAFTQFFRNNEGCSPSAIYRTRFAAPPNGTDAAAVKERP